MPGRLRENDDLISILILNRGEEGVAEVIVIDEERCNGCRMCVDACPEEALGLIKKKAAVNHASCALCGTCIDICPERAIQTRDKEPGS